MDLRLKKTLPQTSEYQLQAIERGFTLIELLIVIVTMFFIFSIGFANLRDFQRRKILEGAVTKVKSALRYAQELSLSGRNLCMDPDARVNAVLFYVGGSSYLTSVECIDSTGSVIETPQIPENSYDLDSDYPDITFAAGATVEFETLGRGVRSGITITLNQLSGGSQAITVTTGGIID